MPGHELPLSKNALYAYPMVLKKKLSEIPIDSSAEHLFQSNEILLNHAHWAINHYAELNTNLQNRASGLMGFIVVEIGFIVNWDPTKSSNAESARSALLHGLYGLIASLLCFIACNFPRIAHYPNVRQIEDAYTTGTLQEVFHRPLASIFFKTDDLDLFEQLANINKKMLLTFKAGITFFLVSQILFLVFVNINWS